MSKKMLIDASHAEENRVVIMDGNQIDEFDYESASKEQLKGNIYLGKVTRVEPSLQACFVEYGGNRQGFLAFSEIHPDYYQIPAADREDLLQQVQEDFDDQDDDENSQDTADEQQDEDDEAETLNEGEVPTLPDVPDEEESKDKANNAEMAKPQKRRRERRQGNTTPARNNPRFRFHNKYKIQEVIKNRQILLVQVVKEERGNKGAALTTYMSLAGRYCVLMPNTTKGGGVSRKIGNSDDRKRLKNILSELDVPSQMAVILRTAGAERSRVEIKRDFEYLSRLWNNIRETTLNSQAPSLIHEEGDIIRRAIRDLYTRDIEDITVAGQEAYKQARSFMRLLMPSHVKRVHHYKDDETMPLFHKFKAEQQLARIYEPQVFLPSGGSLMFNQTEALVAIDVNSGKATRERHIEETALKTNIEAAEEIARQLRLRDLAGLIVIDFIDMEERRHDISVERKLKDALKRDRARIQIGRISDFGLLEMSRQRLRPNLQESTGMPCHHCGGTGYVLAVEGAALNVMRAIEEEAILLHENSGNKVDELVIKTSNEIQSYLLNDKRSHIMAIEKSYDIKIKITADHDMISPNFEMRHGDEELAQPAPEQRQNHYSDQRKSDGRRRSKPASRAHHASDQDEGNGGAQDKNASLDDKEEERPQRRRRKSRNAAQNRNKPSRRHAKDNQSHDDQADSQEKEHGQEGVAHDGEVKEKPAKKRRSKKPIHEPAVRPVVVGVDATPSPIQKEAKEDNQDKVIDDPKVNESVDDKSPEDKSPEDKTPEEITKPAKRKPGRPKKTEAQKQVDAIKKAEAKKESDAGKESESAKTTEEGADTKPANTQETISTALPQDEVKTEPKPKKRGWWNKLVE